MSDVVSARAAWSRFQDVRIQELENRPAKLTYRELLPDEFAKAPREVPGSEMFTSENSRIYAALDESGAVVATFTLFLCPHLEPMWIREDHRHSSTILRRMAAGMKDLLRASGCPNAYSVVLNATPVLHRFAKFFGASPVDGTLYFWKEGS